MRAASIAVDEGTFVSRLTRYGTRSSGLLGTRDQLSVMVLGEKRINVDSFTSVFQVYYANAMPPL